MSSFDSVPSLLPGTRLTGGALAIVKSGYENICAKNVTTSERIRIVSCPHETILLCQ
jgi:hypothetical protein